MASRTATINLNPQNFSANGIDFTQASFIGVGLSKFSIPASCATHAYGPKSWNESRISFS